MGRFLIKVSYTSGSWARMIKNPDDRTTAVATLMESLGGSLDSLYWDVDSSMSYAIVDLPDSLSAVAVTLAVGNTGAFKGIESHELLTADRLREALTLAKDAARVYTVPGQSAVESDLLWSAAPGQTIRYSSNA